MAPDRSRRGRTARVDKVRIALGLGSARSPARAPALVLASSNFSPSTRLCRRRCCQSRRRMRIPGRHSLPRHPESASISRPVPDSRRDPAGGVRASIGDKRVDPRSPDLAGALAPGAAPGFSTSMPDCLAGGPRRIRRRYPNMRLAGQTAAGFEFGRRWSWPRGGSPGSDGLGRTRSTRTRVQRFEGEQALGGEILGGA